MRPWCYCLRPGKGGVPRPREPTKSVIGTYWYLVLPLYCSALLLLRLTLQRRFAPGLAVFFVMAYIVEVLFAGPRQAAPFAAIQTRETVQARDRSNYVENVHLLVENPTCCLVFSSREGRILLLRGQGFAGLNRAKRSRAGRQVSLDNEHDDKRRGITSTKLPSVGC